MLSVRLPGGNSLLVIVGCCLLLLSGVTLADPRAANATPTGQASGTAQYSKLPWVTGQDDVSDLPLVEMPVSSRSDIVVILLTGDGGWAPIDKSLTQYFNAAGLSVLGWDMLHYFWTARTPDSAAHDLARLIAHYLPAWNKRRIAIVGYSLGADTAPFMVRRLPDALRARISGMALLAPSRTTYFEFHVTNWLNMDNGAKGYLVLPEVAALTVPDMLCVGVEDEADTLCPAVNKSRIHVVMLKGGHHFGADYRSIAAMIMTTMHLR